MYIFIYIHIYVHIYVYIHTYIYTHNTLSFAHGPRKYTYVVYILAFVSVYISLSFSSMHLLKGHPWLRLQYFDMMLEGETLGGGGGRAGSEGGINEGTRQTTRERK